MNFVYELTHSSSCKSVKLDRRVLEVSNFCKYSISSLHEALKLHSQQLNIFT